MFIRIYLPYEMYAFHDCDVGVYIRFWTTGKVFNLRRFQARTLVDDGFVRELLYADNAYLVAHFPEELQLVMDCFTIACTCFGLTVLGKAKSCTHQLLVIFTWNLISLSMGGVLKLSENLSTLVTLYPMMQKSGRE